MALFLVVTITMLLCFCGDVCGKKTRKHLGFQEYLPWRWQSLGASNIAGMPRRQQQTRKIGAEEITDSHPIHLMLNLARACESLRGKKNTDGNEKAGHVRPVFFISQRHHVLTRTVLNIFPLNSIKYIKTFIIRTVVYSVRNSHGSSTPITFFLRLRCWLYCCPSQGALDSSLVLSS